MRLLVEGKPDALPSRNSSTRHRPVEWQIVLCGRRELHKQLHQCCPEHSNVKSCPLDCLSSSESRLASMRSCYGWRLSHQLVLLGVAPLLSRCATWLVRADNGSEPIRRPWRKRPTSATMSSHAYGPRRSRARSSLVRLPRPCSAVSALLDNPARCM